MLRLPVILVALAMTLVGCSIGDDDPSPALGTVEVIGVRSGTKGQVTNPATDNSPRAPQLVQSGQVPIAADLRRLVLRFARYAVGDSDTFPHTHSASTALGGESAGSIDDIGAALSNRRNWRICPADWDVYGASSCPVDLLGPITDAVVNRDVLVFSARTGAVACAPTRTGPLPHGRLVVLRPLKEWRSCASDFALVLAADEQGRLRAIDLTLAEP